MSIVLNGFNVDPSLADLMSRPDWGGKRTEKQWLDHFPAHPNCEEGQVPFVEFCGAEWAKRENQGLRDPELANLRGKPSAIYGPGDFDPNAAYLIGFTGEADSAILVDLRPSTPRIIYDCLANTELLYATAFSSIEEFVRFYLERCGE